MALQTNKHYRDPALQSSEDSDSEEIFPPDILNDPSPTIPLTHQQIQPTNQTLASKMAADMPVLESLTQKLTVSEPNLMKAIGEDFTDPYPKIDKEMLALYQNTEKILQTCYESTAEVVAIRKAAGISTAKMNNQTIFLPDHVTHELMQQLEQKLVDPFLEIQLKLVCPTAKVPSRSTKNGAFWDIFAPEKSTIQPRGYTRIETGLSLKIPTNLYGQIQPCPGLYVNNKISCLQEIFHSGESAAMIITFHSTNSTPVVIAEGARLCQLVFQKSVPVNLQIIPYSKQSSQIRKQKK